MVIGIAPLTEAGMVLHELQHLHHTAFAINIGNANFGSQWAGAALLAFPQAIDQHRQLRILDDDAVVRAGAVIG